MCFRLTSSSVREPFRPSRRAFLRALLGVGLSWTWTRTANRAYGSDSPRLSISAPAPGEVVSIRDAALAARGDSARLQAAHRWITVALERLTGASGADAWRSLFRADDRVAIKVNAVGGPSIATQPAVAQAVVQGIREAGVSPDRILIWDRSSRELRKAGFPIRETGPGPLCYGTDHTGYEPVPRLRGSIGSCFSPILTRWATALVNVPVLKDHNLSGVSLSMKNLFGVIHNPNKYHDLGCAPYLADLLACPEVQTKLRLIVCDGLRGQCQGGPGHAPRWVWPHGGLLVGTDSLALDRAGEFIIARRRREVGLPSLEEDGRPAVHLDEAQRRGLGEGRPPSMRVHELEA